MIDVLNPRAVPGSNQTASYFVVMIDYGKRGREAVVDPEITRREVESRIRSGEYKNILFVHHVSVGWDGVSSVSDMTAELLEASQHEPTES